MGDIQASFETLRLSVNDDIALPAEDPLPRAVTEAVAEKLKYPVEGTPASIITGEKAKRKSRP